MSTLIADIAAKTNRTTTKILDIQATLDGILAQMKNGAHVNRSAAIQVSTLSVELVILATELRALQAQIPDNDEETYQASVARIKEVATRVSEA